MTTLTVEKFMRLNGARMRECREAVGLSRDETAERLTALIGPVNATRLNNWEIGMRAPEALHCLALAEVLGVEPERFFDADSPAWVFLSARLIPRT